MVSRPLRCAAGPAVTVLAAVALLGHPRWAAAQAGISPPPLAPSRMEQPPPAAPPPDGPAPATEAPAPSDANLAPPAPITPLPAAAPSTVTEANGATDLSTGAPAPNEPFYQKWWFWTAVGAFAVTAVVIVLASSDSGAPRTNLGNMPAF
jgi:hypothetical protein